MDNLTHEELQPLCNLFLLLYEMHKEEHEKCWPKCAYTEACSSCAERLGLVRRLCDILLAIKRCHRCVMR